MTAKSSDQDGMQQIVTRKQDRYVGIAVLLMFYVLKVRITLQ